MIGHELARRAGLRSFVGAVGSRHWTVLQAEGESALVACELVDRSASAGTVRPRCAHEVAGTVLKQLSALGPPAWQAPVDDLLRALPLHRGCGRDGEPPE